MPALPPDVANKCSSFGSFEQVFRILAGQAIIYKQKKTKDKPNADLVSFAYVLFLFNLMAMMALLSVMPYGLSNYRKSSRKGLYYILYTSIVLSYII